MQTGRQEVEVVVESKPRIKILLYAQQPFIAQGVAFVLNAHEDLELVAHRENLAATLECLKFTRVHIVLIHLSSGISLSDLRAIRATDSRCQVILWGQNLGSEFAFQAIQAGVRGILAGNTAIADLLTALRNVHRGVVCFEPELLETVLAQKHIALTPRQGQIISLVAQGLKNKEIAFALGTTEGTIKVYIYKLFKKLGIEDRLGLALFGLKNLFSDQAVSDDVARKLSPSPSLLLVAPKRTEQPMVH